MCDEVLVDDRKKLGMDSADPQNHSEMRGHIRGRHVKQVQFYYLKVGFD